MDKIKLFNGNILTEPQKKENTTTLLMPDNDNYKKLKVVKSSVDLVNFGDIAYVYKTSGTNVVINGKQYTIINVKEILLCE